MSSSHQLPTRSAEVAPAPLSVRAVDKAAQMLAGRGSTRRRFLYRLAVVGSALAVDPLRFITRPTPAYASVCGSGNSCDAGWSVFCCTINSGANTCPDGSFVAGWWKVDASAFCLGSARYYIDCNRRPNATCSCRCNSSGCDHRRVCCNVFRYGQCNTHIGGVTEVVCRLITCTPPWKWDPACSTTVREDEETRSHSSACLPGKNPSRIQIKYQDLGLVGSVLGKPVTRERDAARNGRKRRYANGLILTKREFGAHEVHGDIAERYRALDAERGHLGYPLTDQRPAGDGTTGAFNRFERGSIYRSDATGARAVLDRADARYRAIGGPRGKLGYPTATTRDASVPGQVTKFQRGVIYMSPNTGAFEVTGTILAVYRKRGGLTASGLGFPAAAKRTFADGGRLQRFETGLIAGATSRTMFAVRGPVADRYRRSGSATGSWGYPTSHTEAVDATTPGLVSRFSTRTTYWSDATLVRWLDGAILHRYQTEGGPAGELGFPTSDVKTDPVTGFQQATFERGTITHDPATGETQVLPRTGP